MHIRAGSPIRWRRGYKKESSAKRSAKGLCWRIGEPTGISGANAIGSTIGVTANPPSAINRHPEGAIFC
jgi:hypothetical protein